jgi:hypothetical protein
MASGGDSSVADRLSFPSDRRSEKSNAFKNKLLDFKRRGVDDLKLGKNDFLDLTDMTRPRMHLLRALCCQSEDAML